MPRNLFLPILIALGLLLGACGGASTAMAGNTPTPTIAPTATLVLAKNGICGVVSTNPRGQVLDVGASNAEQCLVDSYKTCQIVSLTYTITGIDNGTIHELKTRVAGSGCSIADAVSSYIVPNKPRPISTRVCTTLQQTAAGLVISGCDSGDNLTIPAPNKVP